jgi:hypothetical protein
MIPFPERAKVRRPTRLGLQQVSQQPVLESK